MATMIIFVKSYYNRNFFIEYNFRFDYAFHDAPRRLLEAWVQKCSTNLAKSIIELFRMLFRSGLNDFYSWCLPFLNQLVHISDDEISAAAQDVLEEVCFDENSINNLIQVNENVLEFQRGEDYSFISKFLRSERGFKILLQKGWL